MRVYGSSELRGLPSPALFLEGEGIEIGAGARDVPATQESRDVNDRRDQLLRLIASGPNDWQFGIIVMMLIVT